jgi:translation elongation factor EF-1alpha
MAFFTEGFSLTKNLRSDIIHLMKKTKPKAKPKAVVTKVVVKKPLTKVPGKLVGKVTHYFSDINVGVIKLSAPIAQGAKIRIIGGEETDFNQTVTSMQVEHEPVKRAKKGNAIGLKVKEKVRDGYKVYVVKN